MSTWVEDILDKSPLPHTVTAALLIFFTNVILHPIILVPIFQPSAVNYPLYKSGVELFYVMLWSALAAIAIVLLSAYSAHIRLTLGEIGEIFGLEPSASRTLSLSLTGFITGRGCLGTGLIIGSIASFVDFQYSMPSMVSHGWYSNVIIQYASIVHTFFTYMLAGSAVWVLATYAYTTNRIKKHTLRSPTVDMLDRLKVFGVTSLHGAGYFGFIGILALVFSLATRYLGISWGPPLFVGTTIFAAIFPVLFFFGSLKGIHNIIVEVKTSELHRLRTEYWNAHQAFNQRHFQGTNGDDERALTMLSLKIEELDNAIKWMERIPDWPLDLGIIRLLGISVIFPLATSFLGNYLIGMHP